LKEKHTGYSTELAGVETPDPAGSQELEKQALEDRVLRRKKLFPTSNFYSVHHPEAMGFPTVDVSPPGCRTCAASGRWLDSQ